MNPFARCPVCDARALRPTDRRLLYPSGRAPGFEIACEACGLLLDAAASPQAIRAHLQAALGGDVVVPDEEAPYGLDVYTLRIAATAVQRGVEPLGADQAEALRRPHARLAAAARLVDLAPAPSPAVSLGILCRPGDLGGLGPSLAPHAAWTDDIVVLCDDAPAEPRPVELAGLAPGVVRLAGRPLGADFSAQRNALQALSRHEWMLQLDADESLSPEVGAGLGPLVGRAQAQGVRSIGLPRRNLVDGVRSDLYPDTQYRLNHRDLRYRGRVHERPDRPWQDSLIALHGAILHHLGRDHVETRSLRYEAMQPGGGRLEEADRLLAAYRA